MTFFEKVWSLLKDTFTSFGRATVFALAALLCLNFGWNFFLAEDLLFSPSVSRDGFINEQATHAGDIETAGTAGTAETPAACGTFAADTPRSHGHGDLQQCRAEFEDTGDLTKWETAIYGPAAARLYNGPWAPANQGTETWNRDAWFRNHVCRLPRNEWNGSQLKVLRRAILQRRVGCSGPRIMYRLNQAERGWGALTTLFAMVVWFAISVGLCLLCVLCWEAFVQWWRRRGLS